MPAVGRHREEESARGQQDRLQAQYLMDLVFTNNFELVSSIKCEDWKSLSDHRLVVVEISQPAGKEETKGREHFLCDTGRRYGALDFHKVPCEEIKASP